MRRAETLAWAALVGLLAIAGILLAGGIMFDTTPFWAGMMMAHAQALVVGLAGYGLRLARQAEELGDMPVSIRSQGEGPGGGFRMSMGDDRGEVSTPTNTIKTIDTGFQRLLVVISSVVLIGLSFVIAWFLLKTTFDWVGLWNPRQAVPHRWHVRQAARHQRTRPRDRPRRGPLRDLSTG